MEEGRRFSNQTYCKLFGDDKRESVTNVDIRESMYFILFVYYANIKVFQLINFSLFFVYLYVSFLFTCN